MSGEYLFSRLTADLAVHQKLDDEPNDVGGFTAQELKAKFDEAPLEIQRFTNDTFLPELEQALLQSYTELTDSCDEHFAELGDSCDEHYGASLEFATGLYDVLRSYVDGTMIPLSQKSQPGGVPTLDSYGLVPVSQIPDIGALAGAPAIYVSEAEPDWKPGDFWYRVMRVRELDDYTMQIVG